MPVARSIQINRAPALGARYRGILARTGLAALAILALATCGRPLTEDEARFATLMHGDQIDTARIRLVEGSPAGSVTFKRKPRPRLSCREKILPPTKEEIVTTRPAAMTLFNKVLFTEDWYVENYLPNYPGKLHLVEAMLFAHEMTHVWQWQNRARTGYHPLRAAAEHSVDDPYLFDLSGAPDFLSYGYEQQGAIVEEYVCCRAIAPAAPRTRRLHQMLVSTFPVADLPNSRRESDVYLPWKDAELKGICD